MRASIAQLGFTLVELVVTIVLIGILGAVAGPRFFDNSAFSGRGYAEEVASSLRVAQKVAVSSGCDVRVMIDNTGYAAVQRALSGGNCTGAWTVPVLRMDGSTLDGAQPSDVTLSGSLTITFTNAGALTPSTTETFQIGTYTISVDAITGLTSVS